MGSGGDLGFSYRASKGGTVFILRDGRVVTELRRGSRVPRLSMAHALKKSRC